MDVRSEWDFNNPEKSRARFEKLAAESVGEEQFIWMTQLARTHSLEKSFDQAHAVLDSIEPVFLDVSPVAQSYYLLERGRTYNSAGDKATALVFFERAAYMKVPGLAIDAMHMVAIAQPSSDLSVQKNREALTAAEASEHEEDRRWRGSLLNNLGWDLHDMGKFDEALQAFEQALAVREEYGEPSSIHIAKWCIARCLRSLGRYQEALDIQTQLAEAVADDQFVKDELDELAKAMA